jgi:hypothetical protein
MKVWLLAIGIFGSFASWAAIERQSIPRAPLKQFKTDGLFEGGSDSARANLEDLRIASHDGYERWVIDFSDEKKRTIDKVAPRFQIRYVPGDEVRGADGRPILQKPAKFIFTFRAIQHNFITREKLSHLVKKSQWVEEIVMYPPIEKGDTAIEFVLKQNVAFSPHQPVEREGRLVLDLKAAPDSPARD